MTEIILPKKGLRGIKKIEAFKSFGNALIELGDSMPNKISTRGWCYIFEGMNLIVKTQFNSTIKILTELRKKGFIPMDFVANDVSRSFTYIEPLTKDTQSPEDYLLNSLEVLKQDYIFKEDIAFWESQEVYIILVTEKIDLFNLFKPICNKYHIPTANMKGWSDLNSRYIIGKQFKEAEDLELQPILLYYGDLDPDGMRIGDTFKKNLRDIEGSTKYNPDNLIVDRFGLNLNFIQKHNLMWINNLISSNGKDLASPTHKNYNLPYMKEYITKVGKRKCEANAILPIAPIVKQECEDRIIHYLGSNCFDNYNEALKNTQDDVKEIMERIGLEASIQDLINKI